MAILCVFVTLLYLHVQMVYDIHQHLHFEMTPSLETLLKVD